MKSMEIFDDIIDIFCNDIVMGSTIAFLLLIGHIYFAKKLLKEAKQRDVNYRLWHAWCIIAGICPLISMPLIYLLYAIYTNDNNKNKRNTNIYRERENVPDTCPHCKNSNLKKSHECEWCGNKIIE
jgi:hypothetical protein